MRQFQVSNSTGYMRYENIYSHIRRHDLIPENPRVLVFGCSSGQELRTVRSIWPYARVSGCDIDKQMLDSAAEAAPFADLFFSDDDNLEVSGTFDLVCCNSVLCRHPLPPADSIPTELPLDDIEAILDKLIQRMNPNAFLMAYNINHLMSDCAASRQLQPTSISSSWNNSFVPRLDATGKIIAFPDMVDGEVQSYRLVPGAHKPRLEDLVCPLYQRVAHVSDGMRRVSDDVSDFVVTRSGDFSLPPAPANKFGPLIIEEEGICDGRMAKSSHVFVSDPSDAAWRYLGANIEWLFADIL